MITKAAVREQGYEINDRGTITSPGKFEGEPWFVVALWDCVMEGGEDLLIGNLDNDVTSSWFKLDADILADFELGAHDYPIGSWIGVWEDSQGFVRHKTRATHPETNEETGPTDAHYRAAAIVIYAEEGKIEIDEDAEVSRGDDPGAYVQAWLWVPSSKVEAK